MVAPLASEGSMNERFDPLYPIIDTHQHLWNSRFNLTWPKPPINEGEFMLPEYRSEAKGLNFVKSVYMEVAVPKAQRREEALFALDLCEEHIQ